MADSGGPAVVRGLALTAVKGMRLQSVEQINLGPHYGEVERAGTVRVGDPVLRAG